MSRSVSEISVECGGATFRGRYQTAGETVHVASPYGTGSAVLGGLQGPPETLAKLLLYGLAQKWTRRGRHVAGVLSA
jgi:hypothetical protein